MNIVIISDIHDNLVNLEKCLNWCKKEKIINLICCGDVTNSETLEFLADKLKGPSDSAQSGQIYLVRGNIEIYNEEEIKGFSNIKYFGRMGAIKLDDKTIGICHEQYMIDKVMKRWECDIIFYGHTHEPWSFYASSYAEATADKKASDDKEALAVNPGTLGGMFAKPTFAVWDSKSSKTELKLLELI